MRYNNYYNENDDKLNSKVGKTLTYDELMEVMASNTENESI